MFLENKYSRIYFAIIEHARTNTLDGYVEKHHIIPRCLGGTDISSNLVDLTPRQHFICHFLLPKMVSDNNHYMKLLNACMMMSSNPNGNARYMNSRLYAYYRTKFSIEQSKRQHGVNNTNYGKRTIINIETYETKQIMASDNIKNYPGWIYGRGKTAIYKIFPELKPKKRSKYLDEYERKFAKSQLLKGPNLIKLGFDPTTTDFKSEYFRIKTQLEVDYYKCNLSQNDITRKYNFASTYSIVALMRFFDIKTRSISESRKLKIGVHGRS